MKTKRIYLILNHHRQTVKIFSNLKLAVNYVNSIHARGLMENLKYTHVYSTIRRSGVFGFDLGGSDAQIAEGELIMSEYLEDGVKVDQQSLEDGVKVDQQSSVDGVKVDQQGSVDRVKVDQPGSVDGVKVDQPGSVDGVKVDQQSLADNWGSDDAFCAWKSADMVGEFLFSKLGVRGYFSKSADQWVYYDGGSLMGYSKSREGIRQKIEARVTRKLIASGQVG